MSARSRDQTLIIRSQRLSPPCGGRVASASEGCQPVLDVTFYGVRGSTPCPTPANQRDPIVLDLGTGLRFFGEAMSPTVQPFRGTALITHLHWDHVQGLPFFMPINRPGSSLTVYGPPHEGTSIAESFATFMRPPYFPIRVQELTGKVSFCDASSGELQIDDARILVRSVPHVGQTNGYRIEWGGASVAFISDHQQPVDRPDHVSDEVLELCDGVDLLIHDAQYTPVEFAQRATWGHCTVGYALEVARQSNARSLALFHHDPAHDDAFIDRLEAEAKRWAAEMGVAHVFAAAEGTQLHLG
jgi:phosphoribosyl 1,2-cyclic phosphodiesterase